ncbi:MAG: dTDP-4-dehydrorhamnose 3,5-epimerase family protein [Actinomycetota bacterium]
MIEGVRVSALKVHTDSRGSVLHFMRNDSVTFSAFGEVYFSTIINGVVKAWMRNHLATANFVVPIGSVELVMFDERPDSATYGVVQRELLGRDSYQGAAVPPGVWYGFRGLHPGESLIANLLDRPYEPSSNDRLQYPDSRVPFRWPEIEG